MQDHQQKFNKKKSPFPFLFFSSHGIVLAATSAPLIATKGSTTITTKPPPVAPLAPHQKQL